MMFARSLRVRLLVLILTPLALIAGLMGYWRYAAALRTAEELFDRSLLAAALAVSRDVAVSGGDALSASTRDLIAAASGGQIFYHVEGPDRAYLTGYAYPPIPPASLPRIESEPLTYAARHQGTEVVVLRIHEHMQPEVPQGLATVTVWQRRTDRQNFATSLARQSAVLIISLVMTVALIIWFGVNRGLKPLLELEDAIAARSPDDLSQIRRRVPREVRGIVKTLNELFEQVGRAIEARDVFLSNAAHQLRNPVAGMLALAEAAETAQSDQERADRIADLKVAAERTARLTTQMLALERIRGAVPERSERIDLNALTAAVAFRNAERALNAETEFAFHEAPTEVTIPGNGLMLEEALENLIDNALKHGGPGLSRIELSVQRQGDKIALTVSNNGRGMSPEEIPVALERFSQARPSEGSGLGLAIVAEVAAAHSGTVAFSESDNGVSVSILLSESGAAGIDGRNTTV